MGWRGPMYPLIEMYKRYGGRELADSGPRLGEFVLFIFSPVRNRLPATQFEVSPLLLTEFLLIVEPDHDINSPQERHR